MSSSQRDPAVEGGWSHASGQKICLCNRSRVITTKGAALGSESRPVNPAAQLQVNLSTSSTHTPPFRQGDETHSFTSASHREPNTNGGKCKNFGGEGVWRAPRRPQYPPKNPGLHRHWNSPMPS